MESLKRNGNYQSVFTGTMFGLADSIYQGMIATGNHSVCRKSEENAPQQSLPLMMEVARRVGGREKAAISP